MYCMTVHVLYERLNKAIDLQTGPTSHTIGLNTLNMAIAMVQSLHKGISRMVSDVLLVQSVYCNACIVDLYYKSTMQALRVGRYCLK